MKQAKFNKQNWHRVCANYRKRIIKEYLLGIISRYDVRKKLEGYWMTYLPENPEACILRSGMWCTSSKHREVVCLGCGIRARQFGITTVKAHMTGTGDINKLYTLPLSEVENPTRYDASSCEWVPS